MTTKRSRAMSFVEYQHVDEQSMPERIAHALDWAAANHPKQFVAWPLLLKAVMGYAHVPRQNSQEVDALRGRMTRVKSILREKYGRGMTTLSGVGVRATVDSEDQLKTDVVTASRRVVSANRSLQNAASLVDAAQVPVTAENRPWLNWWKSGVRAQLAQIASPEFMKRLLPPGDKEADAPTPTAADAAGKKAAG